MTKNIENIKIDEVLEELYALREQNEQLILENERLNRMKRGLMINNSKLTLQRNELVDELNSIKSMGVWEFTNTYCDAERQEAAGHEFARALLGGK